MEARPHHKDSLSAFRCTESKGKAYRKYYSPWKPAPEDPWAVEIQELVWTVSLPQPDGCRLKLKVSGDGTVLAILFYEVSDVTEDIATVELGMVARHVSYKGMGLGDDVMNHFWSCLKNELDVTPKPKEVQVSAIVRPGNLPSRKLMSDQGLAMLVATNDDGWETWGIRLPWDEPSVSIEGSTEDSIRV